MKRSFTILTAAFMLLAFLAIPMGMMGQTRDVETFTFSELGYENAEEVTTVVGNDVTLTFDAGTNASNSPKYYNTGAGVRMYVGNTLEVALKDQTGDTRITAIDFTFSGSSYTGGLQNWTGSETSHTFTATGTARIQVIAVTFSDGGTPTPTTYTVTYDCNGGTTGCPENVTGIEAGTTITLANAPTKTDYNFAGWNDGNNTYNAGDEYTVNGNVTFTAQWTEVVIGDEHWVLTNLADLTTNDVFVIVGNNGSNYAMSNDNGTNPAPSAVAVTVANNEITSTVAANIQWNISGDATNGYTFYPNGDSENWLYCTNTNNGVRVGTNTNKTFVIDATSGYLKHNATSRYVGIYNSTDWRCYTSTGGNIANQTFAFYKKVTGEILPPSITAANVDIEYNATSGSITYTINNGVDGGTLTASTESDWLVLGEVGETVPFTCSANNAPAERTATVALIYTYGTRETTTANVMVTQAGNPNSMMTIAEVREQEVGSSVFTQGIVTSISGSIAYMQDDNAAIVVYGNSNIAKGDNITVSGTLVDYSGLLEISNPIVEVVSSDNTVTPELMTIAQILESTNQGWYIRVEDAKVTNISTSGNHIITTIEQDENTIPVYAALGNASVGSFVTFNANIGYYNAIQLANPSDIVVTDAPVVLHTYAYSINGILGESTTVDGGESITLAEGSDLDEDFHFAGWTTDANNTNIRHAAGSLFTIEEDVTFYAVYAKTTVTGEVTTDFVQVTSNLSDWSGTYLIVAHGTNANQESYTLAFDGSLNSLDVANNTVSVTINNGRIEASEDLNEKVFTIAAKENGYSILSASGYYIGSTSDENRLKTSTSDDFTNTISSNGYNADVQSSVGPYLRYNENSGQERFRFYKSATYTSQEPIQLFKQGGTTSSTAYYTRVFKNETAEANINITGPSVIPAEQWLNMGEYELTNDLGTSKLTIEEGGQYFGNAVDATMLKRINAYTNGTKDNWYLVSAPMNSLEVSNTDVTNMTDNNYDLYSFSQIGDSEGNEWLNYKLTEGDVHVNFSTLENGQGYLYANSNTVDLRFMGNLVDTTPTVTLKNENTTSITYDFAGFNLIGNPFPSQATLSDTNIPFFRMNSAGTELESVAAGSAIEPLEGVFVYVEEQTDLTFNQVIPGEASPTDDKHINVSVSRSESVIDNAIVSFGTSSSLRKFMLNPDNTKVYFTEGNEDYAVVRSANEGEMPVNFKASENGRYTISVNAENIEMEYLHLIDNMTGADVDLLATPSYSFEANTTDYTSRFRLVFSANSNDGSSTSSETFALFNGSNWVVNNEGEATLQVIDMTGRMLSSEQINGSYNKSLNLSAGVYVLRLSNGNVVKTQKVVID